MNFETMSIEDLEARKAAIGIEVDAEGADLDALEAEARGINEELEKRKAAEAQREEIRSKVAAGAGETKQKIEEVKGEKSMTLEEIRSSKEYVNAYATYIKTGKDEEVRALLTENVTDGTIPVPTIVEGRIRTAWDKLGVMSLVRKTFVKGNLTIGYEASASPADYHGEGEEALQEEQLVIGKVQLIPETIKKWIRVSDEVLDMAGEEFLDYIVDEISYQIARAEQGALMSAAQHGASGLVPTKYNVSAPTLTLVAELLSMLSDEAANPVIVMNRAMYAPFIALQAANGYNFDPFMGLPVYFDNTLPSTPSGAWLIVGDFGVGALANYPNGADIKIKVDDLSESEADLVKIVGRRYVALGIVAPKAIAAATSEAE